MNPNNAISFRACRAALIALTATLTVLAPTVASAGAFAWGGDVSGQLGSGNGTTSVPVAITSSGALSGKTVVQISAGTTHSCALDSDGKAYCWGNDFNGQVGNGSGGDSNNQFTPVAVKADVALAGKTLTQISTGSQHSCALDSAGKAYCWGLNVNGQLGDGTTIFKQEPVAVTATVALANKTLTHISAGSDHTCVLSNAGEVYCWGKGADGRLGNGSTGDQTTAVAVSGSAISGKTLTRISAGLSHTCALDSLGKAYCWGNGFNGRLGNNESTNKSEPVMVVANGVLNNKSLVEIGAGSNHSCAIDIGGLAYCWGQGDSGQLGNGTFTTGQLTPVAVSIGTVTKDKPLRQISAGSDHSCALDSVGKAYCWGKGGDGRLGNGDTADSNTPVAVSTAGALRGKALTQIEAGDKHTLALDTLPIRRVSFSTEVDEANEGGGTLNVLLQVTGEIPDRDLIVPLLLSGDAATGKDYTVAKTVKIKKGETGGMLTVKIKDDTLHENDEVLTLSIDKAKLKAPLALGEIDIQDITITDNDLPPTVTFAKETGQVAEGGKSVILVKLSAASGKEVSVGINLDGSATFLDDYSVTPSLPLTIPAGKTSTKLTVTTIKESAFESVEEEAIFEIGELDNAEPGDITTHTLTIKGK